LVSFSQQGILWIGIMALDFGPMRQLWTHETFVTHHHLCYKTEGSILLLSICPTPTSEHFWIFLSPFSKWRQFGSFILSLVYTAYNTNYLVIRKSTMGYCFGLFIYFSYCHPQLAKKIREKFNRYLDVVTRNKQVVEASYTAHLTSPLTAIQDCCTIPPSMME
jgi:hypothetical protein